MAHTLYKSTLTEREGGREELKDEQREQKDKTFNFFSRLTLHLFVSANDFILSYLSDLESVSKQNSQEAILLKIFSFNKV